jgi:hypothetical protein
MSWEGKVLIAIGCIVVAVLLAVGALWFFAKMMSDRP